MMPTRSASSSASSRYWVVRKMVVPCCWLRLRTSSHTAARLSGSSPVVGSSRKRMSGSWISAAARSRRRFMPPEYVLIWRSMAVPMSTSRSTCSTRTERSARRSP